jgi:hypothetical protein
VTSVFVRQDGACVPKRENLDLRRYAVVGAEQRLLELAEEAAVIFAIFPELRAPGRGFMAKSGRSSESARVPRAASTPTRKSRRRKMSADARRRISEAQKARWAKRKAAGQSKKK